MAKLNILLLAVLVAGCGVLASCSSAVVKVPERVNVPVAVPCVKPEDVPPRPQLRSEADLMAMDRYRRTLAAWSDLKKLEIYAEQLAAIAAGCSRLPST